MAPRRSSTARATASSSAVVTPGLAAARVASCISATTLPALRILASSSSLRLTPHGLSLLAAVVDGPHHPAGHRVGRAGPVDA